jgi:hypothetical protein
MKMSDTTKSAMVCSSATSNVPMADAWGVMTPRQVDGTA